MFPLFISSYMVLLGGQIQTHPTPPWHTMDLALTANTVVIDLTAEQGFTWSLPVGLYSTEDSKPRRNV